jgi:hypothetical protein
MRLPPRVIGPTIDLRAKLPLIEQDRFSAIRHAALDLPSMRSHTAYGYVARRG